jgi:hypothetical protein
MKKFIIETAEEILQEYTSCYSEADEDCLVKMLEKLASNMAREIFAEIEQLLSANMSGEFRGDSVEWFDYFDLHLSEDIAELKKKYESEGAE